MVFSDLFFLYVFLPAFALLYAGASIPKGCAFKNAVLVIFSLIFYAWGEPVYVFLMIGSALINYIMGRNIIRGNKRSKTALVIGIAANIAILATFKYLDFFIDIVNNGIAFLTDASGLDCGMTIAGPSLKLPIGISFYTFQSISYLVDVYRREAKEQKSFGNLLLYISMFPQLIAGPIVRYGTVAEGITSRKVSASDMAEGIQRFIIGLSKKVIIANQMSEVADALLSGAGNISPAGAWIGMAAFTLQIYFDFSGYSDMAIGIGRCIGFRFPENFNHPYCCSSITDFWRRWHMTLGGFFRDYVYIPLGGNRKHQAVNILVVWFLTGMWHGASVNFILWGLYFGIIVMLEKYTILKVKKYIPNIILHIYALVLVFAGWGIFYFEDFDAMAVFFGSLTDFSGLYADIAEGSMGLVEMSALTDKFWLWIVAVIFCMPIRKLLSDRVKGHFIRITVSVILSFALLILCTALLVGATNNAFIYTRF